MCCPSTITAICCYSLSTIILTTLLIVVKVHNNNNNNNNKEHTAFCSDKLGMRLTLTRAIDYLGSFKM